MLAKINESVREEWLDGIYYMKTMSMELKITNNNREFRDMTKFFEIIDGNKFVYKFELSKDFADKFLIPSVMHISFTDKIFRRKIRR